ncbi:MAG: 1-deoxy-D-xylulose-5-phosphate reductoisomerase [Deltaproteobacteria bacterium]|nr:MAG: 1-deoxy-D-xylulose-5-phosphate reductoisomerase [Deltaproteobacteria bacterium]
MPKRLVILGSTGSIGTSTLDVVARFPKRFTVAALTAGRNIQRLAEQVIAFRPELVAVRDVEGANDLRRRLPSDLSVEIHHGEKGFCTAASQVEADMVVVAMVGAAGLMPTLAAIEAGRDIALANKETLVMAGALVMNRVAAAGVRLLPVDSEHSAIFQCLAGNRRQDLERILLTASGGPFRQWPADRLASVQPAQALAHPNWKMGPKITIDSATLMNKGLEVIEAVHLFTVPPERIEVLVHPQSIVHSMVAFVDGSVMAQMGVPDMRTAIAYALSHPERLPLAQPLPDWTVGGPLTFEAPDLKRFPCLQLAFEACRAGGTFPAVLNAANEVAVEAFLHQRIGFIDIPRCVAEALEAHQAPAELDLAAILEADGWARHWTAQRIGGH